MLIFISKNILDMVLASTGKENSVLVMVMVEMLLYLAVI